MKHARKRSHRLIGAGLLGSAILIMGWALPSASAAPVMIVDDGGPDDYPGQKDLNYLTVDYAPGTPGTIVVEWGWDDTAWSGNNTGDACSLFDTDGDGFANYSLCVTVGGDPASYQDLRLYSCGDTRTDRCDQPTTLISPVSSTATVALPANSDPFGVPSSPYYAPAHVTGNTCGTNPGCYTTDTVATVNVVLNDIGGGADPFLLNVCSYPSEEPNSAPSECVVTPNAGYLTIVKVADPNDATDFVFNMGTGQESTTGDDTWTITGSGSVQMIPFMSGTDYDLSEVVPSQWNLDSAACVLQTSPTAPTGDETSTGVEDFEIQAGVETICTFNDSKQAYITVTKVVTNDDGGSALPDDFSLTLEGDPVTSGVAVAVDPGTYTAGETLLPGYTLEGFTGDCDSNGDITVAAGESKSCTLTNDDQQAYITVTKVVTNDDGGSALPNDFLLTLNGSSVTSGVAVPVDPGTYTAGETLLDGYTFEGFTGDCDQNGDVTVALGESKSCTLTNNDQQAYITVTKVVTNDDGGSAAPDDFLLTLNGSSVTSGVAVPVDPGTYTADETQLPGYTFEGFTGDCDSNGDVTVALGVSKNCTLTNNDQQATITVFKTVINDNGGAAQSDDFLLTLEGTSVLSGEVVSVDPGTYTAGETLLDGYTFEEFTGDCDSSGDVTVALGEHKSCTLTNDDQQAYITVTKVVTNDDGGNAAPDDFSLTLEGNAVSSGVAVPVDPGTYTAGETLLPGYSFEGFSGDCDQSGDVTVALGESKSCTLTNNDQQAYITVTKVVNNTHGGTAAPDDFSLTLEGDPVSSGVAVPVDPGTYTAGETLLDGYTFDGFTGDCDPNGDVTVALGESKTCTLTNSDEQATITVVKVVNNDHGGTAVPDDFDLTLEGTPVDSGVAVNVDPGTYTAGETLLPGYTFDGFSGACDANGDVTVALGQNKTCTLTNSDIEPKLTVVKTVVNDNGGTLQVSDFPLFVDSTSVVSGEENGFDAGTYTVSETEQFGYEAGDWGGDCAADGTITLQLADDKTCTITNDDEPGTIVIIKQATPQSGTFHFTSTTDDGNNPTLPPLADFDLNGDPAGGGNQYSQDLDAGTYTVQEAMQAGWILTGIGGSSDPSTPYACTVEGQGGSSGSGDLATQTVTVDLEVGDTVTCVFENSGQGVTRTQGFWATHPYLAQIAWDGGTSEFFPYHTFAGVAATPGIGDKLICGREVVTGTTAGSDGVMGAFWSNIAKKTTGAKRTAIDKARMTLLQQLIAAELNASAFGSIPPGGAGMFAQWEAALCGTNIKAIRNAASQAASFNESGDGGLFTPGTSADPKYARFIADKAFWNIIKP